MAQSEENSQVIEIQANATPNDIRELQVEILGQIDNGTLPKSAEVVGDAQEVSASALQFLVSLSNTPDLKALSFGPTATALRMGLKAFN